MSEEEERKFNILGRERFFRKERKEIETLGSFGNLLFGKRDEERNSKIHEKIDF